MGSSTGEASLAPVGVVGGVEEELRRQWDALQRQRAALNAQTEALRSIQARVALNTAVRPSNLRLGRAGTSRPPAPVQWMAHDDPQLWKQRTFRAYGGTGFVQFSAYRVSRSRFVVIGFTRRRARRLVGRCTWYGRTNSTEGAGSGGSSNSKGRTRRDRRQRSLQEYGGADDTGDGASSTADDGSSSSGTSSTNSSSSGSVINSGGSSSSSGVGSDPNQESLKAGGEADEISDGEGATAGGSSRRRRKSRDSFWSRSKSMQQVAIDGTAKIAYGGDHHKKDNEVALIGCRLHADISEAGGWLELELDGEVLVVYREAPHTPLDPGQGPFPYELAMCGAPMYGAMDERVVLEWLEYHHAYVGVDHFALYDAGAVTPSMLRAIRPYSEAGVVTLTEFRESADFSIWLWAQQVAIHDCGYRMRDLARWAAFQDIDEYVEVVPPHVALKQIINHATYKGMAWFSHGTANFSSRHCAYNRRDGDGAGDNNDDGTDDVEDASKTYLVSPLQFREREFHCRRNQTGYLAERRELCPAWMGHRKYIADPRKVWAYSIHEVFRAEAPGVTLNANRVRHAHYHGLAVKHRRKCAMGPPLPAADDGGGDDDGAAEAVVHTTGSGDIGGAANGSSSVVMAKDLIDLQRTMKHMMRYDGIARIVDSIIACRNNTRYTSHHDCTMARLQQSSGAANWTQGSH